MSLLGSGLNIPSLGESSINLVFPSTPKVAGQVPLWMKFYCYEFMNTTVQRALAYASSAGRGIEIGGINGNKLKAAIAVPAPTNFTSMTAHNYRTDRNQSLQNVEDIAIAKATAGVLGKVPGSSTLAAKILKLLTAAGNLATSKAGNLTGLGGQFNTTPEVENGFMGDTTYVPSGASRNFEIKLSLPCLTLEDSKKAGAIIRAFEALSLPTLLAFGPTSLLTKYYHPAVWVFGIGPANSLAFDRDWSGFPQLSVLKTVSTRKTAFDTNSLSAIGGAGQFKPVAYTTSLVFGELEPSFRQVTPGSGTGIGILSRSSAILTLGGSVGGARVTGNP